MLPERRRIRSSLQIQVRCFAAIFVESAWRATERVLVFQVLRPDFVPTLDGLFNLPNHDGHDHQNDGRKEEQRSVFYRIGFHGDETPQHLTDGQDIAAYCWPGHISDV
jgi:hypothetical protein